MKFSDFVEMTSDIKLLEYQKRILDDIELTISYKFKEQPVRMDADEFLTRSKHSGHESSITVIDESSFFGIKKKKPLVLTEILKNKEPKLMMPVFIPEPTYSASIKFKKNNDTTVILFKEPVHVEYDDKTDIISINNSDNKSLFIVSWDLIEYCLVTRDALIERRG